MKFKEMLLQESVVKERTFLWEMYRRGEGKNGDEIEMIDLEALGLSLFNPTVFSRMYPRQG